MERISTVLEREHLVHVRVDHTCLDGELVVPEDARAVVLFAHGSAGSSHSVQNRHVAGLLHDAGLATMVTHLVTPQEEAEDWPQSHLYYDVGLMVARLVHATEWLRQDRRTRHLPVGYFGTSTGAASALIAAAQEPNAVRAIVCRGGRVDLALRSLSKVTAPTLFLVGANDRSLLGVHRDAMACMKAPCRLITVRYASHLFEETGALEEVARLASAWFCHHLTVDAVAR